MNKDLEPIEPSGQPASDADRSQVLDRLTDHLGAGQLTLAEFEERSGLAVRATTRSELDALTSDLPDVVVEPPNRRKASRWFVAVLGGSTRRGRFRLSGSATSISVLGGDELDLRRAEIDGDELLLRAYALCGGTDIYIPDSFDVVVEGFALFGGNDERGSQRPARPGAPLIRIRAWSLFGGVEVWRLPEGADDLSLKQSRRLAKALERGTADPS